MLGVKGYAYASLAFDATYPQDLRNCVKQAAEFGLTQSGLRIACLSMQMMDVISLGQKATAGMVYTDSFYWDMSETARAWATRFKAKPVIDTMRTAGWLTSGAPTLFGLSAGEALA